MSDKPVSRQICIPIDGSKNSRHAFEWYLHEVSQKNDTIHILNVLQPIYNAYIDNLYTSFVIPQSEIIMKQTVDSGKELCKEFVNKAKDNNLECHGYLQINGNPGEAIVSSAGSHKADMIVMGSRGLNSIKRVFLGSVSDYVLHNAGIPVVVVPPFDN